MIIFQDDFSSGDLSKTQNGVRWLTPSANTKVVKFQGSNALEFTYAASPAGQDAIAEQDFTLGNYYKEVWCEYDLFTPSNYVLREPSVNDKSYLYLWTDSYSAVNGVGGGFANWTNPNGIGDYLTFGDWTGGTDLPHLRDYKGTAQAFGSHKGKWTNIKIQMKAGENDSVVRLWRDGQLDFDISPQNPHPWMPQSNILYEAGLNNRFNNGYLMGHSNNGFDQTTKIYIKNITFSDTKITGATKQAMTINNKAIKNEITNEPKAIGYSTMTDAQISDAMNALTQPLKVKSVTGEALFDLTNWPDYKNDTLMTGTKRDQWIAFTSKESVDLDKSAFQVIRSIFGGTNQSPSVTESNVDTARNIFTSRTKQLPKLGVNEMHEGYITASRNY